MMKATSRLIDHVLTAIVLVAGWWSCGPLGARGEEPLALAARDSLKEPHDDDAGARECLEGLVWRPASFVVRVLPAEGGAAYDRLVEFPSPRPLGDEKNDRVTMEWYWPRDENGEVVRAPAILVVHESGSAMIAGRLFARGLQAKGFHTLMIHLPFYGHRREGTERPDTRRFAELIRQSVADVRRARDAIAVLPHLDPTTIAVQGTSLGGFVVATAASLDACFDRVFIVLAGGQLYELIQNGERDTAKVRQRLAEAGYEGQRLKDLLWPIEPTRIAHRLNPQTTWLYSAKQDQVVPLPNAIALARAARLDRSHHLILIGDHYTAMAHFPFILDHIARHMAVSMAAAGR